MILAEVELMVIILILWH